MREKEGAHHERFGTPAERRDGARRRLSGEAEATRERERHATRWSSRRGSATDAPTGIGTERSSRRWRRPMRLTLRTGNRLTTATITVNFFRRQEERAVTLDAARVTETRHGFATGTVAEHGPVRCGSWRSEEPTRAAREAEGVGDGRRSGPRPGEDAQHRAGSGRG